MRGIAGGWPRHLVRGGGDLAMFFSRSAADAGPSPPPTAAGRGGAGAADRRRAAALPAALRAAQPARRRATNPDGAAAAALACGIARGRRESIRLLQLGHALRPRVGLSARHASSASNSGASACVGASATLRPHRGAAAQSGGRLVAGRCHRQLPADGRSAAWRPARTGRSTARRAGATPGWRCSIGAKHGSSAAIMLWVRSLISVAAHGVEVEQHRPLVGPQQDVARCHRAVHAALLVQRLQRAQRPSSQAAACARRAPRHARGAAASSVGPGAVAHHPVDRAMRAAGCARCAAATDGRSAPASAPRRRRPGGPLSKRSARPRERGTTCTVGAAQRQRVGQVFLDRHVQLQRMVVGAVDDGEAALREHALDLVVRPAGSRRQHAFAAPETGQVAVVRSSSSATVRRTAS